MYTLEKSGSETLVSNLKGGDFAAPRVSTLTNGQFRVVWDGEADSTRERVIGANGAPVGDDVLRSVDRVLVTPLDGGGTFTLTDGGISGNYLFETSTGARLGGTLFINTGGGIGSPIRFTRINDMATDDHGGVYLLLRSQVTSPGPGGINSDTTRVVHFDALGRQTDTQLDAFASDLYALPDGHFAVVQSNGPTATVAVYDAGGDVLARIAASADPIVSVVETGLDRFVVLSRGASGLYQTFYTETGSIVPSYPGEPNPRPLDLTEGGAITSVTATSLIDGSYVVGWTQGDAYIQYFNPDGKPASAAFRVEAPSNNLEQFQLVLKANPIGGFTALWLEGAGGGEAPSLIKSQSFVTGQLGDVSGNTLTGSAGGEEIAGGDGNDLLVLGAGDDRGHGGGDNDTIQAGAGADTLIGAAGNDLLDGGSGFDYADYRDNVLGVRVDLTALTASGTGVGTDRLANIEGVYGSMAGGDTITGNYLGNLILGFGGDDRIDGDSSNDYLDGGEGTDTLVLYGRLSDYFATAAAGGGTTLSGPYGASTVFNFERVQIAGQTLSFTDFQSQAFNGLRYIASNPDLIARFGTDTAAARQHWISTGQAEGRSLTSFDPLRYAASNPDLRAQYGIDTAALTRHFIQTGFAEGRSATSFDPLQYAAVNPDLLRAFGADDLAALTRHFVISAAAEGRASSGFDPLLYGASNDDLARLFGTDSGALFNHWVRTGALEERETATFDGLQYAAANDDLARVYGTDARGAMLHYLTTGADEGRETTGFDAVAYMLSYEGLALQGLGPQGAFNHWLTTGADLGLRGDEFFGREQESHEIARGQVMSGELDSYIVAGQRLYADKDWYSITLRPGERVIVEARGAGTGDGTLADPEVRIYDSLGRLMLSDDNSGQGGNALLNYMTNSGGVFYVVVSSPGGYQADGTYELELTSISGAPADGWVV